MSKEDETLKLALEALESYHGYMEPLTTVFGGPRIPAEQSTTGKVERAITAIREALAEQPAQQQQPREHEASENCWCHPILDYKDPDTGNEVWVHNEPH